MKMVRIAGKRPFYTNGQHFDCLIALVPLIGERWAELAEMPVMAAVTCYVVLHHDPTASE